MRTKINKGEDAATSSPQVGNDNKKNHGSQRIIGRGSDCHHLHESNTILDIAKPFSTQIFIPFKKFNGSLIPEQIERTCLLTPVEKLMYGRLSRYAGQNGDCHPSLTALSNDLCIARSTTVKALNSLEKLGFIQRKRPNSKESYKNNERTKYYFLWHEIFNQHEKSSKTRLGRGEKSNYISPKIEPEDSANAKNQIV